MFGSRILEVAIGVVFVFLLVSIICSAVREAIEAWVKSRAAYLEHGIRELLHDPAGTGLAKSLYEHPLVSGLYPGSYTDAVGATRAVATADPKKSATRRRPSMLASGGELPSYIPTRNFALALMDMAARGPDTDVVSGHPSAPSVTLENIQRNIMGLGNPAVQRVLLTAIDSAQGDLVATRQAIENWYDSAMDRVSGWYKRSTSWILFWIGLGVALMLNVNTITIADYLYRNDAARQAFVARAGQAVGDSLSAQSAREARATLDAAALPLGWSKGWGSPLPRSQRTGISLWFDVAAPAVGLLLTALAATFGAPFWFDLLNKMMVIRSTVKPHEKSREESSEDRQTKKDAKIDALEAVVVREPLPAAPRPAPLPSPAFSSAFTPPPASRDRESNVDGCEVEASGPAVMLTSDEDLPPSFGGVG